MQLALSASAVSTAFTTAQVLSPRIHSAGVLAGLPAAIACLSSLSVRTLLQISIGSGSSAGDVSHCSGTGVSKHRLPKIGVEPRLSALGEQWIMSTTTTSQTLRPLEHIHKPSQQLESHCQCLDSSLILVFEKRATFGITW